MSPSDRWLITDPDSYTPYWIAKQHFVGRGSFVDMVVIGFMLYLLFFVGDSHWAERLFVLFRLVRHRTVAAACGL